MIMMDDLFQGQVEHRLHYKVRSWRDFRNQDNVNRVEVEFHRQRNGIVFEPAYFSILFLDAQDKVINSDDASWDIDVHEDLLIERFKTCTVDNEKERFGLALGDQFERVEIRFGDGFFNHVLIKYMKSSSLGEKPEIADILTSVNRRGETDLIPTRECQNMITDILKKLAFDLTKKLNYTRDEAEEILVGAVAYYLDERFSVTNRRMMGFG